MMTFPFEKYPAHVRQLFGYNWKPIVVKVNSATFDPLYQFTVKL